MRPSPSLKFLAIGAVSLLIISVLSAYAAGLNVPASNVGSESFAVTAEDIKPAACDGLFLTNIVSGSGTLTGTAANDLIIGSAGVDMIDGLGGDDCIVAGNGDDILAGGDGADVCLGGPGSDTLDATCETASQ
jgi:Ca2+-binding RTX toxin-like protein